MDIALGGILRAAKQLYEDSESNDLSIIKMKIVLNGIIEGVENYKNLSLEGQSNVIDSLQLAVDGAISTLKTVKSRSGIKKIAHGSADKKAIEDAILVLKNALRSLQVKIQLANDGFVRGQNITSEEINKNAIKHLAVSDSAMIFWRDFVPEKSWQINTQKAAFYLKNFILV